MRDAVKAIVARNLLFRGLPERIIDRLAAVAVRRRYRKNERIFSQGDDGDALYGVVTGRVRIGTVGATGQEVFLNIMEPDESFGEIAVIDGLPRTAGAVAMDATELTAIRRVDLLNVLHEEPDLGIHLLALFCDRIRWASDLVEETALLAPAARLAKRLLSLATLHGRRTDQGIEFRISQSELAKFLGMSRQNVNEKLQVWKSMGWISVGRGHLLLIDVVALKEVAAGDAGSETDPALTV
jgi:CRP/FNR family transcriptional regulator, cyclic AMP receptor protein